MKVLRTHCRAGHEYTVSNTAWVETSDRSYRYCRACAVITSTKHRKAREASDPDSVRRQRRKRHTAIREEAIKAYGGACTGCGDTTFEHLQFDHIHDDGKEHRKETGMDIVPWLRARNYPQDIVQLLCANCHATKSFYSIVILPFDVSSCIGSGC